VLRPQSTCLITGVVPVAHFFFVFFPRIFARPIPLVVLTFFGASFSSASSTWTLTMSLATTGLVGRPVLFLLPVRFCATTILPP